MYATNNFFSQHSNDICSKRLCTNKRSQSRFLQQIKFIDWCNQQEEKRFLWLAISLFGHIGMVLPVTLLAILFLANNNFNLWIIACAVNVPVLALNLAAQPPKVTLPTMFISLLLDTAIIISCVGMFMLK